MGEVLSELSEKWKILNDVERQSIATAAAGMYRRNAFISLMTNYDKVLQNTTAAQESEGVTAQKQAIYNDSLSASVSRLTASWEKFYLNSINTDTWKNLVKGLTIVISGFASFANVMGGIPTILATVVLTASLFSTKFQGFMSRSFLIAPMLAFKTSVMETAIVMRQFSGLANTWRVNPFVVGFQMASVSVMGYITNLRLAIVQQTAMGRTGWANGLGIAITGISNAMRSLASSAVATRVAMATFQAVATLGLSVALMFVISKVMSFADSWIHAKEKAKDAFDSIKNNISTLSSEITQSETLISTYDELSTKKNKTTEETQKLSEATEKLSSLLPQSVEGFDSEGKAILGSADSLREYLDLKREELEINKQKLVSDFYKNESSQMDDIIEKQNKLNDLKDDLAKKEQVRTNVLGPNNTYTPDEKLSKVAGFDIDINKIKGDIATVQGEILKANSEMSSGLKAVTQTELESLNLSSNSLSNFSKSYMGIISEINESGKVPSQVLSQMFNTFKTDANIKPIMDEWNTSLTGLQKGSIKASEATKIHQDAINNLITAISRANPTMSMDIIKPFVEGLLILSGVAPEAKEKIYDISKALEDVDGSTEDYLENAKDLASAVAKMNDGHKMTTEELYKLIKAHPELAKHMVKENGLLTINKDAIEKVMKANDEAFKKKLDQNKQELEASKKLLLAKLGFSIKEIESIGTVEQARQLSIDKLNASTNSNNDAWKNHDLLSNSISTMNEFQSLADALKAIEVSSQITPSDLIASANPDLNKDPSKKKEEIPEVVTGPYADLIRESAKQNNLSATLVDAVIKKESGFNAKAHNASGASGLTQLMPGTAKDLGVSNVYDPAQSIEGGSKYLAQMMSAFNNDKELALASYNWGIGNVKKALKQTGGTTFADISGIAPLETRNYVSTILSDFNARKNNQTAVNEIGDKKALELTDPAYIEPTDSIIKETSAQVNLTKAKNDSLQKEIEQSNSKKDYQLSLTKTTELIASQETQLQQLEDQKTKINEATPQGMWRWYTDDNEQSTTYIAEFNASSAIKQKTMEAEFTKIQKLRKAWVENKKAIDDTTNAISDLNSTLPQINFDIVSAKIDTFTASIDESNTQLELSKSRMALTLDTSSEYGDELIIQTRITEDLIDTQQKSIDYMNSQLSSDKLSIESKESLTKSIEDATKSQLSYQLSLQNTAQDLAKQVIDAEKLIAQSVLDAEEEKLNVYKTTHETIIEGYQSQIDALEEKNDLEQESIDKQEKLLDISKANLELSKSQLELSKALKELNNVSNERDTRILVDDKWTWQANPQKVKEAQENVESAQENVESAQENLAKTQTDYQKWEKDNAVKHQKELLQDQIKAEQDSIKSQEDAFSTMKNNFDTQWKNMDVLSDRLLKTYNNNLDNAITSLSSKLQSLNARLSAIADANAQLNNAIVSGTSSPSNGNSSSNDTSINSPNSTGTYQNHIDGYTAPHGQYQDAWNKAIGYASGGVNDSTGLAMLHGTKSSAETIFNSTDSKKLWSMIHNLPNIAFNSLSNIKLPQMPNFINNMSNINKGNSSSNGGITIQNLTVNSNSANDLISQLQGLSRRTKTQQF